MSKKDPNEAMAAALAKFQKSYKEIATSDVGVKSALGAAVCALASGGTAITEASILDHLKQRSATAPSHSGRTQPELDVERMQADAAITHLQQLLGMPAEG